MSLVNSSNKASKTAFDVYVNGVFMRLPILNAEQMKRISKLLEDLK